MKKFLLPILFFASLSYAAGTVAVLEIVPADGVELKVLESRHLTDELRTRAREALPKGRYTILTRDNIMSLLPPDSEEAQCLAESCAVDIGRAIGAEYITQGFIGEFMGMLTLTVELYESISGNLLGSFVTEGKDMMDLLRTIREKAPALFAGIASKPPEPEPKQPETHPEPQLERAISLDVDAVLGYSQPVEKKIEPQVWEVEEKGSNSFWVALAFDVIGIGLLAYGYAQDMAVGDRHDKYRASQSDFGSSWKKVEEAKTARNASYIAGGVFLATGIGVHIWF
ncbi:MAG: hypothetical protein FWB90_05365 [Fibromonadales bacterium]|nr:hypothetical protein [Fibromonadales bacterium]